MGGGVSTNANITPKDAKTDANIKLSDGNQLDQYEASPFDSDIVKLDSLDSSTESISAKKKIQVASATKLKRMAFGQQSYMDQHRDYDQTLNQISLNSTVTVDWVEPAPSPTRLVQKSGGTPDARRPGTEGFFPPTSAANTPSGGPTASKKPPPPSVRPSNNTLSPPIQSKHQQGQGDPTLTAVHAPQFIRTPPPNTPPPNYSMPVPQQVLQNSTANSKLFSGNNVFPSPIHNPNNHLTSPLGNAVGVMNKPTLYKSPAGDQESNADYGDDDMIADFSSPHERAIEEVHTTTRAKVPPLDLLNVSANSNSSSFSIHDHMSAHSFSHNNLKAPISGMPSLGSQSQLLAQKRPVTSAIVASHPTQFNTGHHPEGGASQVGMSQIAATPIQRSVALSRPPVPSISSIPVIHNSSPPLIAPVHSEALAIHPGNTLTPSSSGTLRNGSTSKVPMGNKLPNIGGALSMGSAPVVKETKNVKRNRAQLPTSLTHAQPTTGDWLNKRYIVNNYILLEILGTGSYGEVRLCKDRTTDKLFAIKIFSKDFLKKKKTGKSDETFFEDIRREIAIMKKLLHPNILRLFEVLDDPKVNKMYLVLEYMKMGDLVNVLKKRSEVMADTSGGSETGNADCITLPLSSSSSAAAGAFTPLTELEVWNIFRQVVSGIRYLHYQNVVHGDIKPQNLLLGDDGLVKIADFGISQMLSASGQKLADAAGTPAFMSPELCQGQSFSGQLADIWAIGATMFMLKFGHPPFLAKNIINLYFKICNDPLVFPAPIDPGLKNLLENLLVKDPTKRYTLQQIIMHPWFRHPPSLSKTSSKQLPDNNNLHSNNIQRLNNTSTTNSTQNNTSAQSSSNNNQLVDGVHSTMPLSAFQTVSFKPPDNYEAQELAAMTVQVTIDNHDELFMSIGGIKRSSKGKKSEASGGKMNEVNDDDDDDDEVDGNGHTSEDNIKAVPSSSQAMKSADAKDIMDTNWGADVFEMVDDGEDSNDDGGDSDDDDDLVDDTSVDNNGDNGKESLRVVKLGSSESLKSVPHDEMSEEEQEKRSRRFINKITRKSLENLRSGSPSSDSSPAKPLDATYDVGGGKRSQQSQQSKDRDRGGVAPSTPTNGSSVGFFSPPSSGSNGGGGGSSGKVVRLPFRSNRKPAMMMRELSSSESFNTNCNDVDEEMEDLNSMEDFNKMMDTLALQPKQRREDDDDDDEDKDEDGSSDKVISTMSNIVQTGGLTALTSNPINCTAISTCSDRGNRPTQEDRYITIPNVAAMKILAEFRMSEVTLRQLEHFSIACIFDGHSGCRCSHYLSQHFATMLVRHDKFLSDKYMDAAIRDVCSTLDKKICDFLTDEEDPSGSTGVIAVIDGRRSFITVANVGDSLCVLCRGGKAVVLNRMHRLDNVDERDRVKKAGGTIINNRVNGVLAISRAFGDIQFKPERDAKEANTPNATNLKGDAKISASLLVADPDICTEKITQGTQFAVIASDGLWDVMTPQVVVDYVLKELHVHKDLDIVTNMITKEALRRGSIDNVTISIVAFHFNAPAINSNGDHS